MNIAWLIVISALLQTTELVSLMHVTTTNEALSYLLYLVYHQRLTG